MWPFTSSYPERTARQVHGKAFDYIVVGGGTAGCVLASRLSEDPDVSVLLLCKGTVDDAYYARVPLIAQIMDGHGLQTTNLFAEPAGDHLAGSEARFPVCAQLGGATRINGLMMTRGVPGCYNEWADMGNPDWAWDRVEHYFKKFENADCHPKSSHRGHDGPLHLRQFPSSYLVDYYHSEAAKATGLAVCKDANDPDAPPNALFNMDLMISAAGFRKSVYDGYVPKSLAIERQARLTVCTGAVASSLDIGPDGVVKGVRIIDHLSKKASRQYHVEAKREVILCCGTMYTPQLLMLSGIGPEEHLEELKIPVVRALPGVGANLQNHVSFGVVFQVLAKDTLDKMASPLILIWHILLFLFFKAGLFATMAVRHAAWLRTSTIDEATMTVRKDASTDAYKVENIPDIEFIMIPGSTSRKLIRGKGFSSLLAVLAQPFTTGRISLASTDPLAAPVVHHPILEDARDRAVARRGVRFAMRYIEALRASDYPFSVPWDSAPGVREGSTEGSWRDPTDAQIDAFVNSRIKSAYHPTSTCRMAPETNGGVVGQDLKVYGFRNLRIADASVFPKITASHTMAPTLMVAERCADLVKLEWATKTM